MAPPSAAEKRCLYDVLGLPRACTTDEIRSAYRKLALQRHPDKLVKTGVPEADATASFQELQNAYEVLSDERERAWYDTHRTQILYSGAGRPKSSSHLNAEDFMPFFGNSAFSGFGDKGRGFYKVYGDLFTKIFENEVSHAKKLNLPVGTVKEAPLFGNLNAPHSQVNAFYGYWLAFSTVMDFSWFYEFEPMGSNRKFKKACDEENKKIRKKSRREFNDTVRSLVEFVKKRDKRMIEIQMKRQEEMERKKEMEKEKKKAMQREKLERAMAYEEPEWAKVEEVEVFEEVVKEEKDEFYCVACGKVFKSEKQWNNHEQSKKHKEKVAELKDAFVEEEAEEEMEPEESNDEEIETGHEFVSADDSVDELVEQFENGVEIQENNEDDDGESTEDDSVDADNEVDLQEVAEELGLDDDDDYILKAMLAGHKNRKKVGTSRQSSASPKEVHVEAENDDVDLMEYNNRKGSRRNRGTREERARRYEKEGERSNAKEDTADGESSQVEEPSASHPHPKNGTDVGGDNSGPSNSRSSKKDHLDVQGDDIDLEYNNVKKGKRNRGKKERGKRVVEEEKSSNTEEYKEQINDHHVEESSASHFSRENDNGGGDDTVESSFEPGPSVKKGPIKVESDEIDLENNTEARKNRRRRKERGKRDGEVGESSQGEVDKEHRYESHVEEPSSSTRPLKQAVDKKDKLKKDSSAKGNIKSKGRKQKATTKADGHECDTCGQDFESRNKLHKHLSDTGHAAPKLR